MALGPRLDLRQSQQLVMTPQLQQAIKLLALTNIELEAYVLAEVEKNPLLEALAEEEPRERSEEAQAPAEDASQQSTDVLMANEMSGENSTLDVDYGAETFHHDSPSDSLREGALDGSLSLTGMSGGGGAAGEEGEGLEAQLSAARSLADVLEEQALAAFSGSDVLVARHLIDMIDEAGYFTGELAEVAERLNLPLAHVQDILRHIQRFEPTGVGARNLGECLRLQAAEVDRLDPAMARLLDHLDILARGDMAALRRICGVDQEDLADMIREIRNYNPKPGLAYGSERTSLVVPDIFVAATADGGWRVELNNATLPRLIINRSYHMELAGRVKGKADKAFLSECLAQANWLTKALDQRARTIIKVASELVRQQDGFFRHGASHLRPLNLRSIAEAIGMHESTVSRVTSHKYLSCARGIFELKYFFTSAIQAADGGDAVSAEAVKERMRALLSAETADHILSDDKLVTLLRESGFDIARRTVAKYREAMGYGSSVQRRRAALLSGSIR